MLLCPPWPISTPVATFSPLGAGEEKLVIPHGLPGSSARLSNGKAPPFGSRKVQIGGDTPAPKSWLVCKLAVKSLSAKENGAAESEPTSCEGMYEPGVVRADAVCEANLERGVVVEKAAWESKSESTSGSSSSDMLDADSKSPVSASACDGEAAIFAHVLTRDAEEPTA